MMMRISLNENQAGIIGRMKEKDRLALKFHKEKEIVNDPFLHYVTVGGPSSRGIVKITLVPHAIYFSSLTKDRLMYTLNMLWKNYRKYLMVVQEHTHFPY